jgi:hypothetical protein
MDINTTTTPANLTLIAYKADSSKYDRCDNYSITFNSNLKIICSTSEDEIAERMASLKTQIFESGEDGYEFELLINGLDYAQRDDYFEIHEPLFDRIKEKVCVLVTSIEEKRIEEQKQKDQVAEQKKLSDQQNRRLAVEAEELRLYHELAKKFGGK